MCRQQSFPASCAFSDWREQSHALPEAPLPTSSPPFPRGPSQVLRLPLQDTIRNSWRVNQRIDRQMPEQTAGGDVSLSA